MVFLPAAGLPGLWHHSDADKPDRVPCRTPSSIRSLHGEHWRVPRSLQAKDKDDYRDAEPGKILQRNTVWRTPQHFKLIPHTPRITGLQTRHRSNSDCLAFCLARPIRRPGAPGAPSRDLQKGASPGFDEYGDRDGRTVSRSTRRAPPVGYENMGWKDSGDSVVLSRTASLVQRPRRRSW